MDKKGRKMANLEQKMTFLEKKKMLMMIRAIKYTIYEKIALGDRIPLIGKKIWIDYYPYLNI